MGTSDRYQYFRPQIRLLCLKVRNIGSKTKTYSEEIWEREKNAIIRVFGGIPYQPLLLFQPHSDATVVLKFLVQVIQFAMVRILTFLLKLPTKRNLIFRGLRAQYVKQ